MAYPKCSVYECGTPVPPHVDRCVGCGVDVGYPNVRAALVHEEVSALEARYAAAILDAEQRNVGRVVKRFEERLASSAAVICRSWSIAARMLTDDHRMIPRFYDEIEAEQRIPEDNEFDRGRQSVDAALFPLFFSKIQCAALSLNTGGAFGYGDCAIVLRESSIAARSSVFEENSLLFCRNKNVITGAAVPAGYRASWSTRAKLGIAKLAGRVSDQTDDTAMDGLVLGGTERTAEVIEVHVFGPIHRRSVAHVTGRKPRNDVDERIVARLKTVLDAELVPLHLLS